MNFLAEYIRKGIEQRGFRYVFDNRLDPIWPVRSNEDRDAQMEEIRRFASDHGFSVQFTRQGKIAIFRKQKPGSRKPGFASD